MIFTMIGGGAHRLLATSRSALREGVFANGGEMRFYDLNEQRAADMAALLMKSPEYKACPIKISWKLTLDEALKDADLVSVTLLAGPASLMNLQNELGWASGFIGSDNVSYPGAFLALRGAPILMNVARRMEVMCPNAILLDFANPVGVLSAMVRKFTSIRCYGICEGHNNHGWDLTRIITGDNRYDPGYDVDVAGINHLSFIVRGTLNGENVFDLLDRRLASTPDWPEKIKFPSYQDPRVSARMIDGLKKLVEIYENRHALLFSTEGDGYAHFFHEESVQSYSRLHLDVNGDGLNFNSSRTLEAESAAGLASRAKANEEFAHFASLSTEEIPWSDPARHVFHVTDKGDVQVKILCGLAGIAKTRVAVSSLNDGNVVNAPKGLAMEFTHTVDKDGLHPITGLEVPMGVYGTVTSLAVHQTMLAHACGTGDAKDLYEALLAYPIGSDTKAAKDLWRRLLRSAGDYIAPSFMELEKYL
ncbi:MAG: hypothetical protein E7463_02725 [Ruminococcaceae bacterium]|nr:hypothetical protein [Oscillospiraceae bacterium]